MKLFAMRAEAYSEILFTPHGKFSITLTSGTSRYFISLGVLGLETAFTRIYASDQFQITLDANDVVL